MSGLGTMTPLRRLCLERGITRSQLAENAGVARATVYGLESGTVPNPATVKKLADALEMTTADFVAAIWPVETVAA